MAFISPFRGVHFNYDKIDEIKKEVDSSGKPAYESFPNIPECFDITCHSNNIKENGVNRQDVTQLYDSWTEEGILSQDTVYGLYLHETISKHRSGNTVKKLSIICLVRIEDVEKDIIKPHKRASQQLTTDLVSLLQNSKAQFNPISALFSDRANIIFDLLQSAPKNHLVSIVDIKGSKHKLWKIEQPDIINSVQHFFETKNIYISEGHEVYNAAINHKNFLQETDTSFSSNHPANFFMACLSNLEDKDLTMLPIHLLVQLPYVLSLSVILERLQETFTIYSFNKGSREDIIGQLLNRMDELDRADIQKQNCYIGLYHPREDCGLLIESKEPSNVSQLDLDTLTHKILPTIIEELASSSELENLIENFTDPDEALDVCVKSSISSTIETPLLFLMNPSRVEQVIDYADNNKLMPQNATYFYPKTNVCPMIHSFDKGDIVDDVFMGPAGK